MAKKIEKIAVFARNHRTYLDEAVKRNSERPERFTTFRSSIRWAGAYAANAKFGSLKIYFAPIDGEKGIEYSAMIHQVHLDPVTRDPFTAEVLSSELESTKNEGLWEDSIKKVKTLYVISHCVRLSRPFPITQLIKSSDNLPISENYGYSYSLVYEKVNGNDDFEYQPEEVFQPGLYIEGATKQVSVNRYERSSAARTACISHHGSTCIVCSFDFEKVYGELGRGYIHVHHVKSLSAIDDQYEVDPINDLKPVCPNCHAMLHRAKPEVSIDVLRSMLKEN